MNVFAHTLFLQNLLSSLNKEKLYTIKKNRRSSYLPNQRIKSVRNFHKRHRRNPTRCNRHIYSVKDMRN
jgi:hypothetical protein